MKAGALDVSRLVRFTANPEHMQRRVQIVKAEGRTHGRLGTCLGVIEIKGARAHAIVVSVDGGRIECFNPMDLFPHLEDRA